MIQFPLQWPDGWKRTLRPILSRFGGGIYHKPTIAKSVDKLQNELKLLGAKNIVISTNLAYKADGNPYSRQPEPSDQGAAVYFVMDKEQKVIACDSFSKIGCNLWAIALTVEAMRGISRWGCSELMNRAFSGFKALPEQATKSNWWDVLGVSQYAKPEEVKDAWRQLSKKYHPDIPSGHRAKFDEVQNAYEESKK